MPLIWQLAKYILHHFQHISQVQIYFNEYIYVCVHIYIYIERERERRTQVSLKTWA